jgi:hypothetical protein
MRIFGLLVLIFGAHFAFAEVCGLYQYNDYGDRTSLTISDFATMAPQTINYQISNGDAQAVQTMVSGLCYCVDGVISADPTYPGDYLYKILVVNKVVGLPRYSCHP